MTLSEQEAAALRMFLTFAISSEDDSLSRLMRYLSDCTSYGVTLDLYISEVASLKAACQNTQPDAGEWANGVAEKVFSTLPDFAILQSLCILT